jgi:hypothetical protein
MEVSSKYVTRCGVSSCKSKEGCVGAKVLDQVIEASGLPEDFAKKKLEKLLFEGGFDPDHAGLEEIREVLSSLLQDLILATEEAEVAG